MADWNIAQILAVAPQRYLSQYFSHSFQWNGENYTNVTCELTQFCLPALIINGSVSLSFKTNAVFEV